MNSDGDRKLKRFMRGLIRRNPVQPEFHQAVEEVAESIVPFVLDHPEYETARIPFGPGKASNASGIAVSGLEQSQNALRISWTRDEVDARLQEIMQAVHARTAQYGPEPDGYVNDVKGPTIAGFVKVAEAMRAYGVV